MTGIQFYCIIIIALLSAHASSVGVLLFNIEDAYYQEPLRPFFNWRSAIMVDESFGSSAFTDLQQSSYKSV